jgi:hypothetical protein
MARIEIVREAGFLAVLLICGEKFLVRRGRPENLVRLFAVEELPDGRKIGTGQRVQDGKLQNIGWWADEDEVARIHAEWREAIDNNTIPIELALAMIAD